MINKKADSPPPVAVVLPIYRGVEMTVECIEAAMPGILDIPGSQLVAINDASPDGRMQEALDALRRRWPDAFRLLTNERNLGFVATVNRGLRQCPGHDYVLLNSDVIVPVNWLRRLRDEAYARPDVATVTPLSNNTTICTFPEFLQDNEMPFGLSVDGVDQFFLEPKLECVETPTGVGFCMYIRNAVLADVGFLDEDAFGRGYGEENDFCQRAIKKGYVNLISPNLFAYHKGGVSFGAEKNLLVENAARIIGSRYPNFHADVQRFISADPLRRARITRYTRLLAGTRLPKIVHVTHDMGGGTQQHIQELADAIKDKAASILLAPVNGEACVELRLGTRKTADSLYFNMPEQYPELVSLLRSLGVSSVHYHHLMRLHRILYELPKALSVDHLLTIHDFYLLNGNPTLTDKDGVFPGQYDDNLINPLYPLPSGITPAQWRDGYRRVVESARVVIFPSASTQALFADKYAFRRAVVAPHPELLRNIHAAVKWVAPKARYVVGVIGAIGKEKGADLLEALAKVAHEKGSSLDFVLIGYAYRPLVRVAATGPYRTGELSSLIDKYRVDVCLFPARWPETYSYTLSQALDAGLPIIAPSLGAFTERVAGRQGVLLFDHLISPEKLLVQIEGFIEELVTHKSGTHEARSTIHHEVVSSFYSDEYLKNLLAIVRPITDELTLNFEIPKSRQCSRRERILMTLWRLYSHRSMRWVNYVIPFRARRAFKRFLSRRPIQELQ